MGLIGCAKFQNEIFKCYDFTVGRIFHIPIDFCNGLFNIAPINASACDNIKYIRWTYSVAELRCTKMTKSLLVSTFGCSCRNKNVSSSWMFPL